MELNFISTSRKYNNIYFFDIVREWEDSLKEYIKADFFYESSLLYKKWARVIPGFLRCIGPHKPTFVYELNALTKFRPNNNPNIIPNIIDFFLPESQIKDMLNAYKKNRIVLLSSREAYNYLVKKNEDYKIPVRLGHLALSLSDKYAITPETRFDKKYDVVSMGRTNPVLLEFLNRYASTHPGFTYVVSKNVDGVYQYYVNDGSCLGSFDTRDDFFKMMKWGRVGLYATPGIDGGENRTNGFSQVTPRLLEYIACGCHVIARYRKNSDTDFYEMNEFCPSVETYEDFEGQMNFALTHDVDMTRSSNYLKKHYTSVRAKQLQEIIKDL